jgi:hypothetical protein
LNHHTHYPRAGGGILWISSDGDGIPFRQVAKVSYRIYIQQEGCYCETALTKLPRDSLEWPLGSLPSDKRVDVEQVHAEQ